MRNLTLKLISIFHFPFSKLKISVAVASIENHVVIGELLELKASQHDINTPKSLPTDVNWNTESEASQATGGYTISFPLTVLQVCLLYSKNLICREAKCL